MTIANSTPKRLEAIRYQRGELFLLDQLKLPHHTEFFSVRNSVEGAQAIALMKVRGAPAIAVTAALSLAVEMPALTNSHSSLKAFAQAVEERLETLGKSRPTAVNLFQAIGQLREILALGLSTLPDTTQGVKTLAENIVNYAESMLEKDLSDNRAIGAFGADLFKNSGSKSLRILTHCNTGSLATVGYGTALGVIRALHERNQLAHAYATETRPYNQGARLTAFELVFEQIPATLITDSMASFLMAREKIDAVVVGADRVVANGDTANKVGTYQLAIAAKHHDVPFYVAAPVTSIDTTLASGHEIHIEERPSQELTHIFGQRIAADGIGVWNPSFDVTPSKLISGIITEVGVIYHRALDTTIDVREFLKGKGLR